MTDIPLYCNWCRERFPAPDHAQRFCSRLCGGRFNAAWHQKNPIGRPARRQASVLDALRASNGAWLTTADLARPLWGADDAATLRAVYHVVRRLKQTWNGSGLVIESVKHGNEPYRYRLVSDPFEQAVAS